MQPHQPPRTTRQKENAVMAPNPLSNIRSNGKPSSVEVGRIPLAQRERWRSPFRSIPPFGTAPLDNALLRARLWQRLREAQSQQNSTSLQTIALSSRWCGRSEADSVQNLATLRSIGVPTGTRARRPDAEERYKQMTNAIIEDVLPAAGDLQLSRQADGKHSIYRHRSAYTEVRDHRSSPRL